MAERLVLAELDVEESGLVSSLAQTDAAMARSGGELDLFGKRALTAGNFMEVATRRMFSLRSAAVALLGSFTLAGAIIQLQTFVLQAITATDEWKKFVSALKDFLDHRSETEKGLDAITTGLQKAASALHVVTVETIELRRGKLEELVATASKAIEFAEKGRTVAKGAQFALPGGIIGTVIAGTEGNLAKAKADLAAVNTELEKTNAELLKMMGFVPAVSPAGMVPLRQMAPPPSPFGAFPIVAQGKAQGFPLGPLPEAGESMFAFVPEAQRGMDLLHTKVQETSETMTAFGLASQVAGNLIAQAMLEGGVSAGELAKALIKSFAAAALTEGTMELARGFAALAQTWGVPNPSAAAHFTSAAVFFTIGGIAAGASRALGGGAGAGGFGASRQFAPTANIFTPTPLGGQNITVNIEGNVIGDPEEYARKIADGVRRALRDGVSLQQSVAA